MNKLYLRGTPLWVSKDDRVGIMIIPNKSFTLEVQKRPLKRPYILVNTAPSLTTQNTHHRLFMILNIFTCHTIGSPIVITHHDGLL